MAEPKSKSQPEVRQRQPRQKKSPDITATMMIAVVESALNMEPSEGIKRLENLKFALTLGTNAATSAMTTLKERASDYQQRSVRHTDNQTAALIPTIEDGDDRDKNLPF